MGKDKTLGTGQYKTFRRHMWYAYMIQNAPCGICGQRTINYYGEKNEPDSFELDHIISRKRAKALGRPDLNLAPSNVQPSHVRCNRNKSAGDASPGLGELDEDY
jgi:hypothetical protein